MYYHIDEFKITISPRRLFRMLALVGLFFFIVVPVLASLALALHRGGEIEPRDFAVVILSTPAIIGCLICLAYSRCYIIFDKLRQRVYRQTIWGIKELVRFEDIDKIVPTTHIFGLLYILHSKQDRFGRGIIISPPFSLRPNFDNKKEEFQKKVLPTIKALIADPVITKPSDTLKQSLYEVSKFTYYYPYHTGFKLRAQEQQTGLVLLLAWIVLGFYFWHSYFSNSSHTSEDMLKLLLPVLGIGVAFSFITKRIVLDTKERVIKVYYFGIPCRKKRFADVERFNAVEDYFNGRYRGTKVQIKFKKGIITFAKTKNTSVIEELLTETKYILNKANTPVQKSVSSQIHV